eukprot:5595153-Pyramimonas_sp.AAC.1
MRFHLSFWHTPHTLRGHCGHEACEGCADLGAAGACERSRWGLRWSSLWDHGTCEGCADMELFMRPRTV